jgi:hypothetical protein
VLRNQGWKVTHKRVESSLRGAGLEQSKERPRHSRLRLNEGSCIRLRPERRDHVWEFDFVSARSHDGLPLPALLVKDKWPRECL